MNVYRRLRVGMVQEVDEHPGLFWILLEKSWQNNAALALSPKLLNNL